MTVKELKDRLQKYPDDYIVIIDSHFISPEYYDKAKPRISKNKPMETVKISLPYTCPY